MLEDLFGSEVGHQRKGCWPIEVVNGFLQNLFRYRCKTATGSHEFWRYVFFFFFFYTPPPRFNDVEKAVYWFHFHLVRLSVCGQNRVRSVSLTILVVGSISYLHILSSNLRRCVMCNVCFKIKKVKFGRILWICNFEFVFFWLGQYHSIVWVIMRRLGVSSERRRSNCSSFFFKYIYTGYNQSVSNCSTLEPCP